MNVATFNAGEADSQGVAAALMMRTVRVMVHLDRITTRTGDAGTTGLGDGSRLPKHHALIVAIGAVDEANSLLGVVRLEQLPELITSTMPIIQNDLFDLGSDLACPPGMVHEDKIPRITPAQVARLDAALAVANADLPALKSFVLPGGTRSSSYLHLARTVVRRAETEVCAAIAALPQRTFNPEAVRYLNRLSDLMFVWARLANGEREVLWVPGGKNRSVESEGCDKSEESIGPTT